MTRKELVKELAISQGITQGTAEQFIEALKGIIKNELSAGNEVTLGSDFGTFKLTNRTGVIPGSKGVQYSSNSVKFSISSPFKTRLNN